jgi:hypothetical protein
MPELIFKSARKGQYVVNDLGIIKDDASNGKNSFTAIKQVLEEI